MHGRRNACDLSLYGLVLIYLKCSSIAGVKIMGHDTTVMEGGNATLFCHLTETEENLTRIVWQKQTRGIHEKHSFFIIHKDGKTEHKNYLKDTVRFIGNFKENNGSIQLLGLSLLDDGIYTCIFNTFPSGQILTNINVTVHVPPAVKVMGSTHFSDHYDVTLASCVASNARPAAEVLWRLGALDDSLRTETSCTQHSDGTVTVVANILGAPSKHLNQKKIQCVVKHSTLTKQLELDYVINVHYPPELVVIIPDDPTEAEEYHCLVDCNPAPTSYIWIKVNGSTPHSEGNKLFIPKSSSDVNGVYVCTASTGYGSVSGVLYVDNTGSTDVCWDLLGFISSCAILGFTVVFILLSVSRSKVLLKQMTGHGTVRSPGKNRLQQASGANPCGEDYLIGLPPP
ncbi:nectin-3 [Rhinichthys klamathensis goyatoka]|uniref:nectin-3 n=1 Tax=Rhinichthys klamathensis goyatoka TaxID=3034132 RepID=UPI0024B4ACC6|nr:nectin-3 [Rhinichthys klamathensis goyatoka]